ncbi:tRNA lysidine(34) synthetase TilS [Bacillus sp. FJAT-27986]|uniref:tRNA lysidine(34) synthetase TilS n=1 Tax=Bacillus sp. FJAT-27986 TaxID=1743146 RepID=UPI00080ADF46|nr:tRNA lysidine(34) synthetase TilS [Bacillus sp. FJAT-27986]OCA88450.1 tRNA lysidine(34) synthetase TilS [Bacillus sp. FJAT-27986]
MLEAKVTAYINKKQLINHNDTILVGVSGGPDSLALLAYLNSIKKSYNLTLVVAHVDHMFRGEESFEEYLFVEKICEEWGIPFEGSRIDVPKYIKDTGKNPQQASRDCRYAFYRDIMEKCAAQKLALAHHKDDQAESVLMNLIRGTSGMARIGIPLKRLFGGGWIIRPFLAVTREDILEYCTEMNLNPRIDPSNEKDIYTRNRFRKYILPMIKKENSKALDHIQRFSEDLEQDEGFLMVLAEKEYNSLELTEKDGILKVPISSLGKVPKPLQRRVIHLILNYLYQVKPYVFSYVHIECIQSLLTESNPSTSVQLPSGLQVTKAYDQLLFHFGRLPSVTLSKELRIPGKTALANGAVIETVLLDPLSEKWEHASRYTCILPLSEEDLPLRVRNKRDGDRYQPKGFTGHKKLKKLFLEHKIPVHERESWPIIVNKNDQIVWIPGLQKINLEKTPMPAIMIKYVE